MAGKVNRDFDAEVLARISEGESLRAVCASLKDKGCPAQSTFSWRYTQGEQPFANHYARAREQQAEAWGDIIREHSANPRLGTKTEESKDGLKITTGDAVDRSRLEVDALKWLLAKLHPKKYGDKVAIGGADDLGPVQLSWKSRSTTPPETRS